MLAAEERQACGLWDRSSEHNGKGPADRAGESTPWRHADDLRNNYLRDQELPAHRVAIRLPVVLFRGFCGVDVRIFFQILPVSKARAVAFFCLYPHHKREQ